MIDFEKYAKENNYKLSKYKDKIIKMIKKNDGYCPCMYHRETKHTDHKCPCKDHKDEIEVFGNCTCNLFLKGD